MSLPGRVCVSPRRFLLCYTGSQKELHQGVVMAWVNTSPLVKTYTLEEFWQLPDSPDGAKLELIAGVLYMSPPPDYTHDNAVSRAYDEFSAHHRPQGIKGTLDVPHAPIWNGPQAYLEPDPRYAY